MAYRLAADAVLLLHLAFIVFVLLGGGLAFRWRWIPTVHLPAVAWGLFAELGNRICPLTYLENDFRSQAGQSGYDESFVEHYLLVLIYPPGLTPEIQYLFAGIVLAFNVTIYGRFILRSKT